MPPLLNHLFQIVDSTPLPSGFSAAIRLWPAHPIYRGHFPGHPVTPGVVFLQVVHELLEHHLKCRVRLLAMPQCKFLRIVNPEEDDRALLSIELQPGDKTLHLKALGQNSAGIFLKLTAVYAPSSEVYGQAHQ